MIAKLGPWTVQYDPEGSALLYRAMESGAARTCGCPGCSNYLAVRADHFPAPFASFLEGLGVDAAKEVSVRRVAPLDSGHSLYAGSFALKGKIIEGPEESDVEGWRLDVFEALGEGAHLAFRKWTNPPPPWDGEECVRLRFLLTLPWEGEDPSAPMDLSGCKGPADKPGWL